MVVLKRLEGPHRLIDEVIDMVVTKASPGIYVLSNYDQDDFQPRYVGRAAVDLNEHLKNHVGDYDYFQFDYAGSAREAYLREEALFVKLGGARVLDNKQPPEAPAS